MKFTDEQKVKWIVKGLKGVGFIGFAAFNSFLVYRYLIAESQGRERALIREQQKKNSNSKRDLIKASSSNSLVPEELQPEYIEKQRRKYQKIVKTNKQAQKNQIE